MSQQESVKAAVAEFPQTSGVYIMKNASKKVIYVGKAKNLKNRVSSYFNSGVSLKTQHLVSHIVNIEHIITNNEFEALLLENSLIKKWKPKYNINLKDGKTYPVIRITNEPFPRIFRTRYIIEDGSQYFGPYPNVKLIDMYLDLIKVIFPLRRCRTLKKRENPCLYYHIKECSAPCCGKISEKEYNRHILRIKNLLSGRTIQFRQELEKEMRKEAEELHFERAAKLRDALSALTLIEESQTVVDFNEDKRDYFHYARSGSTFIFTIMEMRSGKIVNRNLFQNEFLGEELEAVEEFLIQYYSEREIPPQILYIPMEQLPLIQEYFSAERKWSVQVLNPKGKKEKAVMNMASDNAEFELDKTLKKRGNRPALENLKQALGLKKLPKVIEGFDIAQLNGKFTVSSLVSFRDGIPDRKNYRRFRLESLNGQIDDFKAISEAVARRYSRLLNEKKPLPDLIMIDGGKGQVNAAYSVLSALGLEESIPVVGLAKREEIIYFPGERDEVNLPEGDAGLRVLQYVRDETHRFATGYNQNLRKKEAITSTLENIPGIGPAKSRKLLKTFGSLEEIYRQDLSHLSKTAGINEEAAEMVHAYLHRTLPEEKRAGKK